MAPCVNCRTVSGRPVPNPTWVSPKPAPSDWVTKSRKQTWLFLKPGVFRLARLLPTTSMAVDVALSADSAVENDVNMRTAPFLCLRIGVGKQVEVRADCRDILACIHGLLQLLKLRQLGDELHTVRRLHG